MRMTHFRREVVSDAQRLDCVMSAASLAFIALSVAAYILRRAQARHRMEVLKAGMFTSLRAEIAALAAVPMRPV